VRILLDEDDLKIASFILKGMKEAGFAVDHAADGEDGLHMALTEAYDAAIIDIMLPKLDGLTLIETLRHQKIETPVIILSAKRSVDDRIKGLHMGSDDYLTKPLVFGELLARVRALMRRGRISDEPSHLQCGDLSVNLLNREITRSGKKIELQPREFNLLEYLIRNRGNVVSKTMILEHIYDYQFDPQTNVVDVLVCRLRNKIDKDFSAKMIHTIRGVGYVLKESE
jgi:two-component system OmpR family response regulator